MGWLPMVFLHRLGEALEGVMPALILVVVHLLITSFQMVGILAIGGALPLGVLRFDIARYADADISHDQEYGYDESG